MPRPGDERGWRPAEVGPEAERRAAFAVVALRLELLYAAIGYGMYCALSEGGLAATREWRSWLEWVEESISRRGPESDEPLQQPFELPGWLAQAIDVVEGFERAGAESQGDLFDVDAIQQWARTEFEGLAERARPIERIAGEPLAEIKGRKSAAGKALFDVMQDSLVLAVSDDQSRRAMRASSAEIYELLVAAREEGVWEGMLDA